MLSEQMHIPNRVKVIRVIAYCNACMDHHTQWDVFYLSSAGLNRIYKARYVIWHEAIWMADKLARRIEEQIKKLEAIKANENADNK